MRIMKRIFWLGIISAALTLPLQAQSTRPIYLYVTNGGSGGPGTVTVFKADPSSGVLQQAPGSPFQAGMGPAGVAADPTGRFVYVENADSNDISGYSVNATTGVLTPLPGSPFPAGRDPTSIAVDPTGRFLYVGDQQPDLVTGAIYLRTFSIDSTTGVLTALPGSPFQVINTPYVIAFDPYGTSVNIGFNTNPIYFESVNFQTGIPTPTGIVQGYNNVSAIAITPNNQFAYVPNSTSGFAALAIDPITGALRLLPPSGFAPFGPAAVVEPSSRFLYVLTYTNPSVNSITAVSAFQIDPQSGALTQVPGSPFSAGPSSFSFGIVVDPTAHFVYAVGLNGSSPVVFGFAINSATGGLTPIAGSPWQFVGFPFGAPGVISIGLAPSGTSNPTPSIASLFPASGTTGAAGFGLTVNGANFVPGAVVYFGGRGRATTFVNSTQLTADILAADIASGGTGVVFVFNPLPGGGASTSVGFPVYNPAPIVNSINPFTVTAGGRGERLEVDGSQFITDSVVNFNGAPRTTTYVSGSALQIDITAADIVNPGTASITVTNPATNGMGGGTSNTATLNIGQSTVLPSITQLSPGSATATGPGFTLTIAGTGFTSNSTVNFGSLNLPSTSFLPTQLQAAIPASAIATTGTVLVSVNAPGVGVSAGVNFYVNGPAPGAGTVSPPSVPAGSAALTLTVTGTNFTATSVVLVNGSSRNTTYINSTTLQAQLLSSDFAAGGTLNITVSNQATGGGVSPAMTLSVTDYQVTSTNSSTSVSAGQPATFNFTIAPSNGSFPNPVTFTVSNLPPMTSASFSPSATVTPIGSSVAVTLSISTTPHSLSSLLVSPQGTLRLPLFAVWLSMAALLGCVLCSSLLNGRRLAPQFALAALLLLAAALSACGSGMGTSSGPPTNPNSGTPAGAYTLTVTATSGSVSHMTNVTLNVQ